MARRNPGWGGGAMRATIQQTISELRRTLTDYIEATYHIADPALVEQRRRLLAEVEGIFQEPYLESTPRYTFGRRYEHMEGLPAAAREAFVRMSDSSSGKPLLYNPPYKHQS